MKNYLLILSDDSSWVGTATVEAHVHEICPNLEKINDLSWLIGDKDFDSFCDLIHFVKEKNLPFRVYAAEDNQIIELTNQTPE